MTELKFPDYIEKAFLTGTLDRNIHGSLLRDIHRMAQLANVRPEVIAVPLTSCCGPEEIAWAKDYPKHRDNGVGGMVLLGEIKPPAASVDKRFTTLCGFLMRNFVDARVYSVDEIGLHREEMPDPSCLLIPDFCDGSLHKRYDFAFVGGLIRSRFRRGKVSVLYATSEQKVLDVYGSAVFDLITTDFYRVKEG